MRIEKTKAVLISLKNGNNFIVGVDDDASVSSLMYRTKPENSFGFTIYKKADGTGEVSIYHDQIAAIEDSSVRIVRRK